MDEEEFEETAETEEEGPQKDDVYSEEALEEETENDELDPFEEGFMKGYDKESVLRCSQCGQELGDSFKTLEIDGETYRFCSKKCLEEFEENLL